VQLVYDAGTINQPTSNHRTQHTTPLINPKGSHKSLFAFNLYAGLRYENGVRPDKRNVHMVDKNDLVTTAADIVAAHVANNNVALSDIPVLIASVHSALASLGTLPVQPEAAQEPAVSVRASIRPDYIVCLEDGKKLKMLKRHLMTRYRMTPSQYRAKWNLPSDYPMVAPNYAQQRKELAVRIGLGRKRAPAPVAPARAPAKPASKGRGKAGPDA
jgi:predicted transcriptional regulator